MPFPNKYNVYEMRKREYSNAGTTEKPIYRYDYDEDGVKMLVDSGRRENTQELIDSYADSCDINVLMKRFSLGEKNVLDQVRGFYADVRDFPTSYPELFQRLSDCETMFNSLKPEVRAEFNNSVSEFFSSYGSEDFVAKMKKFDVQNPQPVNYYSTDEPVVEPIKTTTGGVINEF